MKNLQNLSTHFFQELSYLLHSYLEIFFKVLWILPIWSMYQTSFRFNGTPYFFLTGRFFFWKISPNLKLVNQEVKLLQVRSFILALCSDFFKAMTMYFKSAFHSEIAIELRSKFLDNFDNFSGFQVTQALYSH